MRDLGVAIGLDSRTRRAAVTGQDSLVGAKFAEVGARLLEKFQADEAARIETSRERYAARGRGQGAILDNLRAQLAHARAASLYDDRTPCITRFDAVQILKSARAADPRDQGLSRCATHAEHMWHQSMDGVFTVGDLARLKAHYTKEYPKSKVGSVLEEDVTRAGFQTLPVARLAQLASQVVGQTEGERQARYEDVVRANGLEGDAHYKARAALRAFADLAVEAAPVREDHGGLEGVVKRVALRMASWDDPILARYGQMAPEVSDVAEPNINPAEAELPHDEDTEVLESIDSPITGEPLVVELGQNVEAPESAGAQIEPAMPSVVNEENDVAPGVVASMTYMGQLAEYESATPELDVGVDGMTPESQESTSVIIEDPSSPGSDLEMTLKPVAPESPNTQPVSQAMEPPGEGVTASRVPTFKSFIVIGGHVADKAVETWQVPHMPAALRCLARTMRQAGAMAPYEVRAQDFRREAWVMLDDALGNYVRVVAENLPSGTSVMDPTINNGHVPVTTHVKLTPTDGLKAMTSEPLTEVAPSEKKMDAKEAARVCAQHGLKAANISDRLLNGKKVRVGSVSVVMNDDGDLVLTRGNRVRVAGVEHIERVVRDFTALAARELNARPKAEFRVRALFSVICARCHTADEYVMPDQPDDVQCTRCGYVSSPEHVAAQLESRRVASGGAEQWLGYLVSVDIPGTREARRANAKRMLRAIKKVVNTEGAVVKQGQLEVICPGAKEAELNRLRLVLTDIFGAREFTAQQVEPVQQAMPGAVVPPGTPQAAPQPPQPAQVGLPLPQYSQPQPGPVPPSYGQAPQVQAGMHRVQFQTADGQVSEVTVRAASAQNAADLTHSFMPDARILHVAQMDGPPPPAPAPGVEAAPLAPPVMPMAEDEDAPENIETAAVDAESENKIRAGLTHFRNTGLSIDNAIKSFVAAYGNFLDEFGDSTSPARHTVGAAITRIAKEVYESPVALPAVASRRKADYGIGDDYVNLPGAGKLLGSDSSQGHGSSSMNPKVRKKRKEQPGTGGGSTELGSDSSTKDPGRFDAPKPPAGGSTTKPKQKLVDTDMGSDEGSGHGDNDETASWDSLSGSGE